MLVVRCLKKFSKPFTDNGGAPEVISLQIPGVEAHLQTQMTVSQAPLAMAPVVDLLAPTFLTQQMIVPPDSDEKNFSS